LTLLSRLTRRFRKPSIPPRPELMVAKNLIKAVDKGGIPLNPIKVNQIARELGLEVATSADMQNTIARIREALKRA
jgi:hypothetical protein